MPADLQKSQQSFGSSAINNLGLFGGDPNVPYAVDNTNWYRPLPYGFKFYNYKANEGDPASETFYLPISPNNLTVKTHYATNIITTLYGVVEEHSEVRYYDIIIQGNTGYAPRFVDSGDTASTGRGAFDDQGIAGKIGSALGGFLPEVSNTISQVQNVVASINEGINGIQNPTGIEPQNSGYAAFHNFYKFLLRYKRDTSGESAKVTGAVAQLASAATNLAASAVGLNTKQQRKVHPLQFLNYKDGIKYDVVPISFDMMRSADNPMLYNYVLRLRAFNLQNVNAQPPVIERLAELGLGGLESQSLFGSMASIAGNAATLVSAIL